MLKFLLPIAILTFSLQCKAQDPDLFQTWYLYSIEFENGDFINVANFDPSIFPDLVIEETFDFNGQGACNTFEGNFNFDSPDSFEVMSLTNSTDSCGFYEDMFEDDYFGFFYPGTYMISNIETGKDEIQTLTLHGGPFTTLTFRNEQIFANPDFNINAFSIYPNPTTDLLSISSENLIIEQIYIYSLLGELILEQKYSETHSIDVSSLSEGIYFLEARSINGRSIQKFIKK